jgi:hypothetical protein
LPVLERVDVEQEQPARADKPSHLREGRPGDTVGKHVHGDVGHDRIEAAAREGKPPGHVGHRKPGHRAEPGSRLPDSLAGQVDRRDRITLSGQPRRVVAGSAAQLKDGAYARLSQREQEWLGPQASPVQIIARLTPLPEELIPEFRTRIGHFATVCRSAPRN